MPCGFDRSAGAGSLGHACSVVGCPGPVECHDFADLPGLATWAPRHPQAITSPSLHLPLVEWFGQHLDGANHPQADLHDFPGRRGCAEQVIESHEWIVDELIAAVRRGAIAVDEPFEEPLTWLHIRDSGRHRETGSEGLALGPMAAFAVTSQWGPR